MRFSVQAVLRVLKIFFILQVFKSLASWWLVQNCLWISDLARLGWGRLEFRLSWFLPGSAQILAWLVSKNPAWLVSENPFEPNPCPERRLWKCIGFSSARIIQKLLFNFQFWCVFSSFVFTLIKIWQTWDISNRLSVSQRRSSLFLLPFHVCAYMSGGK